MFFRLMQKVSTSFTLHKSFWTELGSVRPQVNELQRIGGEITANSESCKTLYREICLLNPNHYKTLELYANYTKYVLNDKEESQKI